MFYCISSIYLLQRVDLVADTYREVSIINGEREHTFITFMKNGENKTRLIELICQVIKENNKKALNLLQWKENYCLLINENGSQGVEHKKSNQEEADTKVVLHCLDTLKTPEATFVLRSHSGDTDIMVLVVTLIRDHCERLFIDHGSKNTVRPFVLMKSLCQKKKKRHC